MRVLKILWLVPLVVATAAAQRSIPANWTNPVAPFRVIDNIYYVGTEDLAAWLITGAGGHVLVDAGLEQNAAHILAGIKTLGFNPREVRYLLTTQAHFDHVAAFADIKQATGAQVLASAGDAPLLENGGKGDYLFTGAYHFPPVRVDRRITDGEVVRVGGVELTAHITPGHTQGATTWSVPVRGDDGETLQAVIVASTHVNEGTTLVANDVYPAIADDFARSLDRIGKMKVDVFLAAHMSAIRGIHKAGRVRAGVRPNPFIDRPGFTSYIERSRKAFEAELAKQRGR